MAMSASPVTIFCTTLSGVTSVPSGAGAMLIPTSLNQPLRIAITQKLESPNGAIPNLTVVEGIALPGETASGPPAGAAAAELELGLELGEELELELELPHATSRAAAMSAAVADPPTRIMRARRATETGSDKRCVLI